MKEEQDDQKKKQERQDHEEKANKELHEHLSGVYGQ